MGNGQHGQSGVIVQKLAGMKTLLGLDHVQILLQEITEQFVKETPRKQFHVTLQIVQVNNTYIKSACLYISYKYG